jgi:2-polyprenyl-6-methoxyphenol hydroxylase-like FAD-dependent oxidoreductase
MREALVVGAGRSGLQLALTLQENDCNVTVMSARAPEEIRGGRVPAATRRGYPPLAPRSARSVWS